MVTLVMLRKVNEIASGRAMFKNNSLLRALQKWNKYFHITEVWLIYLISTDSFVNIEVK